MWAESRTLGIISQASTPRTTGTPRTSLPHFHHPGRFYCQLHCFLGTSIFLQDPYTPYSRSLGLALAGPYGTRVPGRTSGLAVSSFSPTQKSTVSPRLHKAWSELSCSWPHSVYLYFVPGATTPCHHVPFLIHSCSVSQRLPARIPTSTRSHPSTSREVRVPLTSWVLFLAHTVGWC